MSAIAASMFGLFVANMTNISIPLTAVHYDVKVISFASHITIHQTYKNVESRDLECVYGFPINDQAAVVGLTITIGDRTITSQFKKKDEAFKEYTDALIRGDGAYLLDQSDRSDDTFVMSVGRLPPGKEATITISYVGTLESVTGTKMRLTIPTSLYPRYNPTPQAPKGVAPPEKYLPIVPYKATLSGHIEALIEIADISSPTHNVTVTNRGLTAATVKFTAENQPLDRDLFIEIDLLRNPEHYAEVESTGDGKYTAMYAFVPDFKADSSAVNTEIIFLVDCSGSMSGDEIEEAKRAMQIFLRSIPEGSYFNFYRFGSRFESLFNQSELYSADTFALAKAYGEQTRANLGGTEVLRPLQAIYASAPKSGFSRQIFLLTDGEVSNTEQVISLVRANSGNTRLFSFGIGQSPSRSLVNGVASAGNGKAEFIKKGQEPEAIVARQLNRALQPSVTDAVIEWNGVKNVQQVPAILPPVFKGDRQLVYAIFERDDTADASEHYIELRRGASKIKIPLVIPPAGIKSTETPVLIKLAARALIKQIENSAAAPAVYGYHGSRQNRAPVPVTDEQIKEKITTLSLSYGVLSKYVSLVAVENRSQEERGNSSVMALREVPIMLAEARQHRPNFYGGARSSSSMHMGGGFRGGSGSRYSYSSSGRSYGSSAQGVASPPSSPSQESGHTTPLSQLLSLQQWNGAWTFSSALEKVTNVTEADVKALSATVAGGIPDEIVSTVFVVTFVEEKYPEKADIWQAIVRKATGLIGKQSDTAAITALKSALKTLIKAK